MDKGNIIKQAFLKLGDNNAFNDNKGDKYKVADGLLDKIISTIAIEADFLFNAVTTKLTSVGQNNLGENKFNLPIDYLNIITADKKFRIEGEFAYSKESELNIQYCRKIPLSEYPANMFDVLVLSLAKEIALAFSTYNNKYMLLKQEFEEVKRKVIYQQGYLYEPWGD